MRASTERILLPSRTRAETRRAGRRASGDGFQLKAQGVERELAASRVARNERDGEGGEAGERAKREEEKNQSMLRNLARSLRPCGSSALTEKRTKSAKDDCERKKEERPREENGKSQNTLKTHSRQLVTNLAQALCSTS